MNQAATVKEKVEVAVADGTRIAAYVARPQLGSYEPHAARQAWALTLEFLRS